MDLSLLPHEFNALWIEGPTHGKAVTLKVQLLMGDPADSDKVIMSCTILSNDLTLSGKFREHALKNGMIRSPKMMRRHPPDLYGMEFYCSPDIEATL